MYNWSVDEKQFKNIKEIINFLKNQPEVVSIKRLNKRDEFGNAIIKTKLSPSIHPVRRFFIAHHISERAGELRVSIIDK